TANFDQLGIGGGFNLTNFGNVLIQGDMSFYSGSLKTVTNAVGASISVNGNLSLNDNTTITNEGYINLNGSLNLYTSSAQVLNRGVITMSGSLSSQGQFNNQNVVNILGSLNYWGGQMTNTGQMEPKGSFSISAGLTYVNQCKMITKGAINNYGTLVNNGLIWAGTTNTSADQFTNSGTFISAKGAKLRTATLINYNTITGAGYLYATAVTTLGAGATVGVTGITSDTIVMFDATRSNPATMFDNQWGTVRQNAVFRAFAAPDSLQMFATCSDVFKTGAILPLKWNYFYAKLQQQSPVLTWSAEYEAGMKFEIERSYDNAGFQTISSVVSNSSGSYSYTDVNATGQLIYYRIKSTGSNGAVKYSEVRVVKLKEDQAVSFAVYPNPTQ
ncbi:MAG TPA: hypothetical protein VEB42_17005, partial [Chitinophagaceae bacterium]|nr:hypothetical protein [Chitinophagaceae bacterium]